MASNLDTLVTVFGGSGFLGRNVVRALAMRDSHAAINLVGILTEGGAQTFDAVQAKGAGTVANAAAAAAFATVPAPLAWTASKVCAPPSVRIPTRLMAAWESRMASARTTFRPRKPDPPKTVTSVSRFDAMASIS